MNLESPGGVSDMFSGVRGKVLISRNRVICIHMTPDSAVPVQENRSERNRVWEARTEGEWAPLRAVTALLRKLTGVLEQFGFPVDEYRANKAFHGASGRGCLPAGTCHDPNSDTE